MSGLSRRRALCAAEVRGVLYTAARPANALHSLTGRTSSSPYQQQPGEGKNSSEAAKTDATSILLAKKGEPRRRRLHFTRGLMAALPGEGNHRALICAGSSILQRISQTEIPRREAGLCIVYLDFCPERRLGNSRARSRRQCVGWRGPFRFGAVAYRASFISMPRDGIDSASNYAVIWVYPIF